MLEFTPNEPAYPSDLGIWNTLNTISKGTTREAYQEAYDSLGAERWRRCKVYFRATSYPGSWLLKYWYYCSIPLTRASRTATLLPFPDDPPCTDCRKGTVENAEAH